MRTPITSPDNFQVKQGTLPPIARKSKYPFAGLKVGEYFSVDSNCKAISSIAYNYGQKYGSKFSVRKVGNELQVYRVK